ncbi:MAG: hypothetical protein N2V77_04270 [Canidatus Methanoxibalbensis ujae]|nr:hypothetical protein [Candidatus Methanoxibalbensis ujae]MCW7079027.1 hypothetical protein [Candidatus Methanoxibalbensis ujae]
MRVRVEIEGENGIRTVFEREGDLLNEDMRILTIRAVVRFLDEHLSSIKDVYEREMEELTIKERILKFLKYDERAPPDWFTSSDLKRIYEEVYEESVKLSTISTYLAQLHEEGVLERRGSRAQRKYRLVRSMTAEERRHNMTAETAENI